MSHPSAHYLNTPVGEQLLEHYARRDAVRHSTRLLPLRLADIGRFFRAVAGHPHRKPRTV